MPPALYQLRQSLKKQLVRVTGRQIYLRKLLDGLQKIRTAPLESLRRVEHVEEIIAGTGLAYDRRRLYGTDNRYMNFLGPGLWQIPRQLAQALCLLSELDIRAALEIGTYQGWTACVLAAYLRRFNKDFCLTTIDPVMHFTAYSAIRDELPVVYLAGRTSADIADHIFDLCLIDGDHSYTACARDYKLCGRFARVCMFHDINDRFVGSENVPRFWQELKDSERDAATFHEFELSFGKRTRHGYRCSHFCAISLQCPLEKLGVLLRIT